MHLVILLYALFASLFTLQKDTLNYCDPFFMVGSRMLFAGLILLAYIAIRYRPVSFKFKPAHIGGIAALALSQIYLTNIFEIWAIKHMISSKACLLYSLSPFISALVAYVILKETMSRKKMLGMFVGFLGLMPIIFAQTSEEISSGTFLVFTVAELAMVGAVFTSVYGWIQLKKVMTDTSFSPLMANGLSMTIGGVLALMHSYFSGEQWAPLPVSNMQPFIVNTIVMCLISNLICYNLYGYLLKRFSATFMSFVGLITPLFASLFGFIWLNEIITWHYFVSMVLFSVGLIVFYREEMRPDRIFEIKVATDIL